MMFRRFCVRSRQKLMRQEDIRKNFVFFSICFLIFTFFYAVGFVDHFLEADFSEFKWPPYIDVREQVVRELMGQNPEYMYMNKWDDFETSLSPSCVGNRLTRRKSLLILVKSSPDRLQNRDAIRATWGKKIQQENWRIRTVFVMGEMREHDVDVYGDILQAEQKQFGDLLVGEFKDHYRNNTLKFMHSIKYARNYCKSGTVPYVLLLDDDYLLSLKNLCTELDKHPPNEHLYMGWRFDTSPFRLIFQKHRVSLNMYPYNRFPPYISAGAVLLTSQTVDEFYLAIQYSKIFPFDDIYTGILAYQLDSSSINLVDSVVLSSSILPTLQPDSNYSNEVSVTSLSSSLIGGYGDSYGIALIGIANDGFLQWESVDSSGSIFPLPEIPESFSSLIEIQICPDLRETSSQSSNQSSTKSASTEFNQYVQSLSQETTIDGRRLGESETTTVVTSTDNKKTSESWLRDPSTEVGLVSSSTNTNPKTTFVTLVQSSEVPKTSTQISETTKPEVVLGTSSSTFVPLETIPSIEKTNSETSSNPKTEEKTSSSSILTSPEISKNSVFATSIDDPTTTKIEERSSTSLGETSSTSLGETSSTSSTQASSTSTTPEISGNPLSSTSLNNLTVMGNSETSSPPTSSESSKGLLFSTSLDGTITTSSENPSFPSIFPEISTNSLTSDFPVDSQAQESGSTPTFLNISTREVTTTNSNPSSSSGTSPSEFTPSTTEKVINCTNETSGLCGFCTKDSTKKRCFVSITPLLFDLSDVDHKIEVELELTKVIQEIGVAHCSLITEDGNTIDVATEVEGEDISLEFSQTFDTETSIFLTCSINGEIFLVNQTILIASFENLVKHQTPFISGFDKSTVSHKSVLVTFIEALPSQFASDSDSGAACILDGKTGKRYPAKWETPSIISCELDSTIPVGTINVYTIRRRELEDATFEFQTPFSISITGGSSTSTSSTTTPSVMSASFTSDLNGIIVELGNSASDVVDQVFDCLKIFLGANSFGTNSICKISNKTIEITFGQSPTITPKDPLLVRSGLISSDLSSSSTLSSGVQYDVIMMTVPSDAVSPEVDLVDPGQVISCQASVTLNSEVKSGNGNRNLSYSWGLQDGGTPELGDILQRANSSSVVLDIVNIGSGATIFVNSCNFVEKCSDSLPLSITVGNEDKKFSVQISGIPSSPLPAVKIVMEADPSLMNCNKTIDLSMKNITYDWSINGNTVTHDAVYTIPARVNLPNSVLTVGLTAKYWNPDIGSFMEADTSKSIQYGVEPLVLVLDGEERTVSAENTVIMDASLSYDPNSGSQNLNHSWNCSKASGANCSELNVDFSRPKLVIPGGTLKAKEIYFFTDTISNNLGATILGKVSIDVVEAKIPSIQILPILETSISTESYLRIQALVQSQTGDLETEWQLLKSATNQPQTSGNSQVLNVEKESVVNISSLPKSKQNFNDLSPGSLFVISFTIPPKNSSKFGDWTGLDPGNYSARLIASNSDGEAFTDVEFEVLPPLSKPRIYATPLQGLSALQTTIELSTDESEISNNPILLKFGLRTILVGNRTDETWFRESAVKTYRTILAAAWPEPYAPCDRVAYEGLLQVCDLAGSCTQTATDRFVVQHPMNESEALKGVLEDITADISSGDIDSALQKLRAVQQEQCNNTIDSSIADSLIDKVLNNLENSTDPEELLAGINVCAAVISSASSSYVLKVVDLLTWTQSRLQGLSTQPEARIKRSIPDPSVEIENTIDSESPEVRVTRSVVESQVLKNTMDSSSSVKMEDSTISSLQRTRTRRSAADSLAAMANVMTAASPETNADVMLSAFDLTVQSNLDIAEPYINNILTHISTFCQSVDSTRTMTAQGKAYTSIQAEGLVPSEKDFLNSSFTIALNLQNSITFDSNFQQYFSNYKCGQNMELTCIEVCLGSAMIDRQILFDNTYIKYYFFPTEFNAATFNNLVSNFHLLLFEDTQIESTLNLQGGAKYTVLIPLSSYIVSNYYQCFVYSKGFWDNTVCTSQEYATKVGNNMYSLGCSCILSGIVAVFTVTPPTPPYYPPLNEVLLTFNLSTTTACSAAQMSQFLLSISSATTVSTNRFQNITCSPGSDESLDPATLVCYLRPPFKEGQTDNSHTIQSITRAVGVTGGLQAYGKIFVTGFTADVVERTLQGDGNARKIPLRINKSFRDVVGNDSDSLEQKWSKAIATTMGVDQYRIKNPIISDGIIFNFTITLPFENEKSPSPTPLSAEELSLLVMEQTIYNEIDLRDNTNQPMPIDPLAYDEIVKLVVQTPTNSLMTILAIVVSTVILLSSFCVGGLVILKIRTDRLIEAHNRNIRTVDIDPNDPLGVVPFESNGVIIRPTAFSKHMDKAADTVVFGQNPITTRHR